MKRLLPLVVCLLLAACAPRNNDQAAPANQPVLSPDQQMANFLGDSHPGASASFSGTSYGDYVISLPSVNSAVKVLSTALEASPVSRSAVTRKSKHGVWLPVFFLRGPFRL